MGPLRQAYWCKTVISRKFTRPNKQFHRYSAALGPHTAAQVRAPSLLQPPEPPHEVSQNVRLFWWLRVTFSNIAELRWIYLDLFCQWAPVH